MLCTPLTTAMEMPLRKELNLLLQWSCSVASSSWAALVLGGSQLWTARYMSIVFFTILLINSKPSAT